MQLLEKTTTGSKGPRVKWYWDKEAKEEGEGKLQWLGLVCVCVRERERAHMHTYVGAVMSVLEPSVIGILP